MKIPLILLVALVASGIAANIDGPDSAIKELDDLNQELDDFILEDDDDEEEDEFDEEDEEQSSLVRALPFLRARAPTCDRKIKKSCSNNYGGYGYCVTKPFKANCKYGTLKKNGCKGKNCACCLLEDDWCWAEDPILKHGKVTIYGTQIIDIMIGDTIDFKCNKGYVLVGAAEAECLPQREWSNEIPHCERSTGATERTTATEATAPWATPEITDGPWCTADIPILEHGKVTIYGGEIIDIWKDEVIEFECDAGYELIGASEATCLPEGEWSNEIPHCELQSARTLEVGTTGVERYSIMDYGLFYSSTKSATHPPTPTVTQVVPDNRLLPFIRIRDEHIQWSQGSFFSLGEEKEQNYTLVLAQGPGTEKEFVYIQNSYPQDGLIDVCDLQYGSYMIDDDRKGFFFVYHDKMTQNPGMSLFGLKANGVDQTILDAINESTDSSTFPGTTSSSFWNFNWLYGDFLRFVRC